MAFLLAGSAANIENCLTSGTATCQALVPYKGHAAHTERVHLPFSTLHSKIAVIVVVVVIPLVREYSEKEAH